MMTKPLFPPGTVIEKKPEDLFDAPVKSRQPNFAAFAPKVITPVESKSSLATPAFISNNVKIKENPKALFASAKKAIEVTPDDITKFSSYSKEEIAKIKKLVDQLINGDEHDIISFGSAVNQKLSSQVDQLLRLSMTPLEDAVKNDLNSIVTLISSFNLVPEKNWLSKFTATKQSEFSDGTRVNLVLDRLTILTETINGKMKSIQATFEKYEDLMDEVDNSNAALLINIKALEEVIGVIDPSNNLLARFENRLNDLNLSLLSVDQTKTQIAVTKRSKLKTLETIQNLLEITIPAWKKQLLSAHTLSSNGNIDDSITKLDKESLKKIEQTITENVKAIV